MSQIEGVPAGIKAVAYREARPGDHVLHPDYECPQRVGNHHEYSGSQLIVEKDNIYNVWLLEFVKIPEGYERAGDKPKDWFREPNHDDYYVSSINLTPHRFSHFYEPFETTDRRRIILRKKATKKRFVVAELELPAENDQVMRVFVETINSKYGYRGQYSTDHRIEEREVA